MNIVLHPRAAPSERLRVWIGVFNVQAAPGVTWFLDGIETVPAALRSIASVRPDNMLSPDAAPENQARVFAGVFEFSGLVPDTVHSITVQVGGSSASIETRTLPAEVPLSLDGSFNVLLVSCFHQHEDKGLAGIIASQLKATSRPHLTLLMGDQVYLDLPTIADFKDDSSWLAEKFESDYSENWQGPSGYAQVLGVAPSVSMPDDHEFWNNYPHPSPIIGNSYTEEGRGRWRRAARALYEGFQLPYPTAVGQPTILEVPPLSFFMPDMRCLRKEDRSFVMDAGAHAAMKDWVDKVIFERRFGVIVTGQSLFTNAASGFSGSVEDFELPNYGDYGQFMGQLGRLADAGLMALCLTGDVHYGRVVQSVDAHRQRPVFYEIISSPSSLVSTVGLDQVRRVGGFLGGLFGRDNAWPRHSDAAKVPDFLAPDVFDRRFHNTRLHPQKGNNMALLRFSRHGSGVEVRITFWPIHRDHDERFPKEVGPYQLTSI